MRRLSDGEQDILNELNNDARSDWDTYADEGDEWDALADEERESILEETRREIDAINAQAFKLAPWEDLLPAAIGVPDEGEYPF